MTGSDMQTKELTSSTRASGDTTGRLEALNEHIVGLEVEFESYRKTRKKKSRLAWAGFLLLSLGGCGVLLGTPHTNTYESPDRHYTVEVTTSSFLNGYGTQEVELFDCRTGHQTILEKIDEPALFDFSVVEIIWKRDSKSFAYVSYRNADLGGSVFNARKPLSSRQYIFAAPWVKQEISARIHHGIANDMERSLFNEFSWH